VTAPLAPVDGFGGIATLGTHMNMLGDLLYDNSGAPGNPLNPFFTNGFGGYFEPGLPSPAVGELPRRGGGRMTEVVASTTF
jgi:hypothetical protein